MNTINEENGVREEISSTVRVTVRIKSLMCFEKELVEHSLSCMPHLFKSLNFMECDD